MIWLPSICWFSFHLTFCFYRKVDVGRDLCKSSGSTPLLKQGHLRASCPGPSPDSLQRSPRTRTPPHSQASAWSPQAKMKKCFLMFWGALLCFRLCLLSMVVSSSTTGKSLALSSLPPPFRRLYRLIRSSPWAFSSPEWTVPARSASPHRQGAPVLVS